MNCREVENVLPAYVDGELMPDGALAAHLETCRACAQLAHAQMVSRTVLNARGQQLSAIAPPGLRTRLRTLNDGHASSFANPATADAPVLAWTGRLSAFAAAAMVVLTLGAVLFPVATIRSTAVLAAQLALDHLKCFTIDGDADGAPMTRDQAEATLKREYDLVVKVPASVPADRLELIAVRRCLYGDGRAAHLMYRLDGQPVSLFVIPGLSRPPAELSIFGHDQRVWTEGDRTYMLVSSGGDDLSRVASYLRNEAK